MWLWRGCGVRCGCGVSAVWLWCECGVVCECGCGVSEVGKMEDVLAVSLSHTHSLSHSLTHTHTHLKVALPHKLFLIFDKAVNELFLFKLHPSPDSMNGVRNGPFLFVMM